MKPTSFQIALAFLLIGGIAVSACSSSREANPAMTGDAVVATASGVAVAADSDIPHFSANQIRAHMAFLSSDDLEGRDTGTRGYDIAAKYVAANFERLGVEPAGDDGTYFNEVTLQITSIVEGPSMMIDGNPVADAGFAVYPHLNPNSLTVSGEAVFVGFGIDAAQFGIEDYSGLDVTGKVAVAAIGGPDNLPGEESSYFTSRASKAKAAAKHGASAIIFVGTPAMDRVVTFDRRRRFMSRPTTTWLAPDGSAFSEYGDVQVVYVSNEVAAQLFEGAEKSYETVRSEAEQGTASRFALPHTVALSQEVEATTISSPNVVGMIPGSDPVLRDEYVVLSAHLDHEGIGRPVAGDSIYNGALDNSAGISVLIEVARAFRERSPAPKRSLVFLALTAEERGLLGSEAFAAYPTIPKEGIVANVNLDMPLLLYDFTDVVAFGAEHSSMGETVERAAAQIGIGLSPDPMPEQNLFTRSDHYSFVKEGVPSVFLVTGFANGGEEAFGMFLQSHYHRPSDEITLPINFEAGAKFARVNYLIANELADADNRPTWNPGNFFGEQFGTR
ncbi:MAG: M28 family peptidase [Rhodothermia bacterium]|nr:M28 family peptidase [Rhodothermia bacterium]